jgi:hypothetical protein
MGFIRPLTVPLPDSSPSIAIIAHSISLFSSPLSLPLNSPLTKSSPFPLAIIKVHELASECRQTIWKKKFLPLHLTPLLVPKKAIAAKHRHQRQFPMFWCEKKR